MKVKSAMPRKMKFKSKNKGPGKKTGLKKKPSNKEVIFENNDSSDEEMALMEGEKPLSDVEEPEEEEVDEDNDDEDDEELDLGISGKKHKDALENLKETDPELYKFLQAEDADLLDFKEDSEDEAESGDEEEDEEEELDVKPSVSKIPKCKKDGSGRLIIDGNLFGYLQDVFDPVDEKKSNPSAEELRLIVDAFQACVARVGADVEAPKYIVNEQAVFEAIIRLCFQNLSEHLLPIAKLDDDKATPDTKHLKKSKRFKRFKPLIKCYLHNVLLFLNEIQSPVVIRSTLGAISQLLPLFETLPKLTRILIKNLVRIWTRKTLDCRVMAYVCLNKLLQNNALHFSHVYKTCYLGFVSNSREVSLETWPLLQFMHRTFAELTLISPDVAYPYVFVYIRQTAIHLRNAIISKKRKDLVQTIYNWQLVQCLYLWVRVISKAHAVNGAEAICELAYPLTQIIIGVEQLYPSQRYLPLRLHCISMLIQMQVNCTLYIPTMALAVKLLDDLSRIVKHKPKASKLVAKSVDLDSLLKLNAGQLEDPQWRSAISDSLFRVMLQASHSMCSQPGFVDMAFPISLQLRSFVKHCRSVETANLFKGLIGKLDEHCKFVKKTLIVKDVDLCDEMSVRAQKFALNDPDSPLRVYYRQWEKVWKMKESVKTKSAESAPKEAAAATKKNKNDVKTIEKDAETSKAIPKPKKKRARIGPAASKADATVPDKVADLGSWSDED